ncbi:hypothetical protein BBK82_31175 [Lentzea guizhouensis]|uniref:CAAX prenyl protease 2/Lysostaphin resistance protein A-like domain-containing protein n=1 Tax=Lentzea guizhouensis TaxID=1586287 RepID=A0A1B2HQ52_9PSEU|nr:hypothetical protein BBK82_31175 [Lentzea guizhouensis]
MLLPAVLLTVRWAGRQRPGSVNSVEGRVRWRWLAECGGWSLAAAGLVVVAAAVGGERWNVALWPGWATFATLAVVTVLVVPFQAAAEEYLCRGWLLQVLSSWTRVWWPAALTGTVLFVVLHEYTDPLVIMDLAVFSP